MARKGRAPCWPLAMMTISRPREGGGRCSSAAAGVEKRKKKPAKVRGKVFI